MRDMHIRLTDVDELQIERVQQIMLSKKRSVSSINVAEAIRFALTNCIANNSRKLDNGKKV